MAQDTPIDAVSNMVQQGLSDPEIIRKLAEQGYSPVQIADALNQAKIKKEISGSKENLQPSIMQQVPPKPQLAVPSPYETQIPRPTAAVPSPMLTTQGAPSAPVTVTAEYPAYPYQYPTAQPEESPKMDTEAMEEIAEEIVNEKWSEIKSKISDVIEWKLYAEKRITSIDDRIKRMELSMDRLQAALLSKVQEYGRDVKELGTEMAGLEGAFGKILSPFVENMRELSRITGELKGAKAHAGAKPVTKTVTTTTITKPKDKVAKKVTKTTVKK